MKTTIFAAVILCTFIPSLLDKPPRVFILAGQFSMDGPTDIRTFDYIGDDPKAMAAPASMPEFKGNVVAVETAPLWSAELSAIDDKRDKRQEMRSSIDNKDKDHANADGHMTDDQKEAVIRKYEADLICPIEATTWQRGASNFGFHYLGCAKTFALMGKAFAQANLKLLGGSK